ncbi:MAG: transglycosylase SLT domain-containing protein [Calditrichia bacterium]
MKSGIRKLLYIIPLCLWILGCNPAKEKVVRDLPEIMADGKLVALTGYSATSYFLYKGQPMGYEYELLSMLAKDLNLKLEIKIENDLNMIFEMLETGEGDIIARGLTVTAGRKKRVAFTEPLFTTQQVLVQRKPENWQFLLMHQIEEQLIRSPIELIGETVVVKEYSSHLQRLKNLSQEVGGPIHIRTVKGDTTMEQLIAMVAEGKIDYTVADEHIALINQAYHRNLDVETSISFPQNIAWAVRKDSPLLLDSLNHWLREMKKVSTYYVIYNKYFKNRTAHLRRMNSEFLSLNNRQISPWDTLLKKNAPEIGWDWRLLASLVYQESQFNPASHSWAGARGLMQLMPSTARQFGARNIKDPQENLQAGVRYLKWLDNYWLKNGVMDSEERLKFVLASYNVGFNHIQDARRLAEKYQKDPNIWDDNVAEYVLKLSEPEYFRDPVVQYGYCRGIEPVKYVADILERYQHYTTLFAGEANETGG